MNFTWISLSALAALAPAAYRRIQLSRAKHRSLAGHSRIAKRIALGKAQLQLAGVLQQRLDHEPTTFVDNNYDERRVMYFSAELEF